MRNAGLEEAQAGIKIAGRNIRYEISDKKYQIYQVTSDMNMVPHLRQKAKNERAS